MARGRCVERTAAGCCFATPGTREGEGGAKPPIEDPRKPGKAAPSSGAASKKPHARKVEAPAPRRLLRIHSVLGPSVLGLRSEPEMLSTCIGVLLVPPLCRGLAADPSRAYQAGEIWSRVAGAR